MKIAIMYVCTGKYEMFWDNFYSSCEKHFYSNIDKEYFVFTDSKRVIESKNSNVHTYYQAKSGWPYDTLLRYNWFCTVQDKLSIFDYCYYVNANAEFIKDVTPNNIPFPTSDAPLVLSIHPRFYDDEYGITFNPERNPKSEACVQEGTKCRSHCGAFWGATREAFIEMSCILRDRTAKDLNCNFIAIWHDQSHLIKYATEIPHINISNGLVSYEEYANYETCVLIFPSKSKYGGNDNLREVSATTKFKHLPKKIYAKLLVCAKKIHIDKFFSKVVNSIKRK